MFSFGLKLLNDIAYSFQIQKTPNSIKKEKFGARSDICKNILQKAWTAKQTSYINYQM